MQDGKALQAGTSHFLGQNFAKSFDVKFLTRENQYEYVWATSWGVSTRLMGALIMTHSDDNGLVLPPDLAPIQVVFIPIFKNEDEKNAILNKATSLLEGLKSVDVRVKIDATDQQTPGFKFADYELKGVPIRLAMGMRDVENDTIEVVRRDTLQKETLPLEKAHEHIVELLKDIQTNCYQKALDYRTRLTRKCDSYEEFKEEITKGGFLLCHWDGTSQTEELIKNETKATIRCIPFVDDYCEEGKCMVTGKPSKQRVVFSIAY